MTVGPRPDRTWRLVRDGRSSGPVGQPAEREVVDRVLQRRRAAHRPGQVSLAGARRHVAVLQVAVQAGPGHEPSLTGRPGADPGLTDQQVDSGVERDAARAERDGRRDRRRGGVAVHDPGVAAEERPPGDPAALSTGEHERVDDVTGDVGPQPCQQRHLGPVERPTRRSLCRAGDRAGAGGPARRTPGSGGRNRWPASGAATRGRGRCRRHGARSRCRETWSSSARHADAAVG